MKEQDASGQQIVKAAWQTRRVWPLQLSRGPSKAIPCPLTRTKSRLTSLLPEVLARAHGSEEPDPRGAESKKSGSSEPWAHARTTQQRGQMTSNSPPLATALISMVTPGTDSYDSVSWKHSRCSSAAPPPSPAQGFQGTQSVRSSQALLTPVGRGLTYLQLLPCADPGTCLLHQALEDALYNSVPSAVLMLSRTKSKPSYKRVIVLPQGQQDTKFPYFSLQGPQLGSRVNWQHTVRAINVGYLTALAEFPFGTLLELMLVWHHEEEGGHQ